MQPPVPSTRSLRPKSPPLPAVLKEIKPPPTPSPRSSNAVKKTESSRGLNSERASTSRAHPPPITAVKTNNTTRNISKIVPPVKASPSISKPNFIQAARASKLTVLSSPNLKSSKSVPAKKPVRSKSPVVRKKLLFCFKHNFFFFFFYIFLFSYDISVFLGF